MIKGGSRFFVRPAFLEGIAGGVEKGKGPLIIERIYLFLVKTRTLGASPNHYFEAIFIVTSETGTIV